MREIECQIEIDRVDTGVFSKELKDLICAQGQGCSLETERLEIDVCSNQAQKYETILDIGPKDSFREEAKFHESIVELLSVLWAAGITTRTFHEFSESLPFDGNKICST